MSWKPRKCVIALLTLAALACFAALIAVNIRGFGSLCDKGLA